MSIRLHPQSPSSTGAKLGLAATFALFAIAAYSNSFQVPFIFDDVPTVVENATIRQLGALSDVFAASDRGGITSSGRPLVNLSLAINRAVSGPGVWSYHAVNLAIHLCSGLVLWGVLTRTFAPPVSALASKPGASALPAVITALWLLHPIQTQSVTYIVQRAEALGGLFSLLTLYCFIRGSTTSSARRWFVLSTLACLLGITAKETVATAPLIVFLYDRTFVSGTFVDSWRRHSLLYLSLMATWLPLAALVLSTQNRGGTAGFGLAVTSWDYLLTQCEAIATYLRLTFWPSTLVFDYGTTVVSRLGEVAVEAAAVLALIVATIVALVRWPALGFCGAWFFLQLAPSSSFIPIASQTIAEHRMYLALAAPLTLAALALHRYLGASSSLILGVASLAAGWATFERNHIYRDEVTLWTDTVTKRPTNARAHNNLGRALLDAGKPAEARTRFETATELKPDEAEPHFNLGLTMARLGDPLKAVTHYERALQIQPAYAEAWNALGNALVSQRGFAEAALAYRRAITARPDFAEAHSNLGNALLELGDAPEALRQCETALQIKPDYADAAYNAGNALAELGRFSDALRRYQQAVTLRPEHAPSHNNLANVLLQLDRPDEAITHYRIALNHSPGLLDARRNLAFVLAQLGRNQEAAEQFKEVLRIAPADSQSREALTRLRGPAAAP